MIEKHLQIEIMQCRGQNRALLGELDKLSEGAKMELYHLIHNLKQEVANEQRTFRPFPHGPKIRI